MNILTNIVTIITENSAVIKCLLPPIIKGFDNHIPKLFILKKNGCYSQCFNLPWVSEEGHKAKML